MNIQTNSERDRLFNNLSYAFGAYVNKPDRPREDRYVDAIGETVQIEGGKGQGRFVDAKHKAEQRRREFLAKNPNATEEQKDAVEDAEYRIDDARVKAIDWVNKTRKGRREAEQAAYEATPEAKEIQAEQDRLYYARKEHHTKREASRQRAQGNREAREEAARIIRKEKAAAEHRAKMDAIWDQPIAPEAEPKVVPKIKYPKRTHTPEEREATQGRLITRAVSRANKIADAREAGEKAATSAAPAQAPSEHPTVTAAPKPASSAATKPVTPTAAKPGFNYGKAALYTAGGVAGTAALYGGYKYLKNRSNKRKAAMQVTKALSERDRLFGNLYYAFASTKQYVTEDPWPVSTGNKEVNEWNQNTSQPSNRAKQLERIRKITPYAIPTVAGLGLAYGGYRYFKGRAAKKKAAAALAVSPAALQEQYIYIKFEDGSVQPIPVKKKSLADKIMPWAKLAALGAGAYGIYKIGGNVHKILGNVEKASRDLPRITGNIEGGVGDVRRNVTEASGKLSGVVEGVGNKVSSTVDKVGQNVIDTTGNVKDATGHISSGLNVGGKIKGAFHKLFASKPKVVKAPKVVKISEFVYLGEEFIRFAMPGMMGAPNQGMPQQKPIVETGNFIGDTSQPGKYYGAGVGQLKRRIARTGREEQRREEELARKVRALPSKRDNPANTDIANEIDRRANARW